MRLAAISVQCIECKKEVQSLWWAAKPQNIFLLQNNQDSTKLILTEKHEDSPPIPVCEECLIAGLKTGKFDFIETKKANCSCLEKELFEVYEKSQRK